MGSTREQNAHLYTFLCCPREEPKNSHTEAGESRIHILLPTLLIPFTSPPLSSFNTLGPKPWDFSDPNSLCSKTSTSCIEPLVFITHSNIHGTFQGIFTSQRQCESPVPAKKQGQHFCRTLSFAPCGHRRVTCSEPSPLTDAVLKAPSWNPLSCHMKGQAHTTHGYRQKQHTASSSLQRVPTEF